MAAGVGRSGCRISASLPSNAGDTTATESSADDGDTAKPAATASAVPSRGRPTPVSTKRSAGPTAAWRH